jgi:AcrR family transcriptional regulator
MSSTAASAERRTQAQRTAATRAKLLDATIECLAELGYSATTSGAVALRAGVSRGAQTHHFPRRVDLIVSAVEEIAARRLELWMSEIEALPAGPTRVRRALDLLWDELCSPLWVASMKLWVAADDDPELYERMVGTERRIATAFSALVRDLLGGEERGEGFNQRLNVVINAMRGLAVARSFEPIAHRRSDPWPKQRRVLEELLG